MDRVLQAYDEAVERLGRDPTNCVVGFSAYEELRQELLTDKELNRSDDFVQHITKLMGIPVVKSYVHHKDAIRFF